MSCENVCRHNKFGFCKYGKTCRKRHIEEDYDNKECETIFVQKDTQEPAYSSLTKYCYSLQD